MNVFSVTNESIIIIITILNLTDPRQSVIHENLIVNIDRKTINADNFSQDSHNFLLPFAISIV